MLLFNFGIRDYDASGNRLSTTQGLGNEARVTSYLANALDQYHSLTHPRTLEIVGQAAPGAAVAVSVDGGPAVPVDRSLVAHQTGEPDSFRFEAVVPGTGAHWLKTEITATSGGVSQTKTGFHFVRPASEEFVHDADGNLTGDARWKYEWDAENRLAAMEEKPRGGIQQTGSPPRKRLTFAYDYMHRRIAKTVFEAEETAGPPPSVTWKLVKDLRFVYDGWNMIAELDHTFATGTGLAGSRVVRRYAWGPDLAGQATLGQALETFQGTTYFRCYVDVPLNEPKGGGIWNVISRWLNSDL